MPRIVTSYWRKPIPTNAFDWEAIDDETYGGEPTDPIGRGATEAEAIADLLEQLEEREGAQRGNDHKA